MLYFAQQTQPSTQQQMWMIILVCGVVILMLVGILFIHVLMRQWKKTNENNDAHQKVTDHVDAWSEAGKRVEYFIDDVPDEPPSSQKQDPDQS